MNARHEAPRSSLSYTRTHTYVIVIVVYVIMFMDYQFVHSEALFHIIVCFIDGLLPQEHRELVYVSLFTEKNTQTCKPITHTMMQWWKPDCLFFPHPSSKQCAAVTTQHGEMREPPQRKSWLKIAATHGCDSISVKEPFTILYIR